MLYVVEASQQLFNKAKELEQKFNIQLSLKGVVQNDMFMPVDSLNESFEAHHNLLLSLQNIYQPQALKELIDLQTAMYHHIINCTLKASDDLIDRLCAFLGEFTSEETDVAGIKAAIEITRNHIRTQVQANTSTNQR